MHDVNKATYTNGLALVGPAINSFPEELSGGNADYTSFDAYKFEGEDPILSKKLTQSIAAVERRVNSLRSTFSTVENIIGDLGRQTHRDVVDRAPILKEWRDINKSFEGVLVQSRKVANDGALMIRDFLSTIIPYLLDDGDLKEKQRELGEYRETLKEGEECAGLFANEFLEISHRVMEFKQRWAEHAKEAAKRLRIEVENLQSDLVAVRKSIDETEHIFLSVLARKHFDDGYEPRAGTTKKLLKVFVDDAEQASKTQKRSESKVSKLTMDISKKMHDVVVVWNLIQNDIRDIESQIKLSQIGDAVVAFRQRIEKMAVQYVHLMKSLQNYAKALSLAGKGPAPPLPTPSLWRKLFT